ncbi:hypothetical protein [Rathayibacter sp. VKM Ac-2857]|uniref:hypothetical protein n=1 Tax=Rathayibacter sp. VKM Ac-2857 TaxID=2739020 RepID=UPI00156709AF|nr:hypothetical protein [Rathayibacter sp. VKM Ac-2857]NQX15925.1 hypothetical protein [Rathayibacter sp. VKM Ac-2857]
MSQIPFAALRAALSGSKVTGTGSEYLSVPSDDTLFVEPTLLVKESLGDLSADVILVSARGAAGKSRTATQLAADLNAPLWRLEKDSAVSRTALSFNLDRYTSSANYLAQVSALAAKPVLLIDSLDEARARVSARSWDEFLDSIIEAAAKGLRCVIFGRERTLEEAWVKLADSGAKIAWLEVSHFEKSSWTTYIDGRVIARDRSSATEGTYYVSARDSILNALSDSLTPETAENFVGYAPVLDAVATTLLDEQNHYSLSQEFASTTGSARHIDVLKQILKGLLIRDQGKLAPLARELRLPEDQIFSPQEQLEWLWHVLGGSQEPSLGYIDDEAKQHEYTQKIGTFIEDHLFRSDKIVGKRGLRGVRSRGDAHFASGRFAGRRWESVWPTLRLHHEREHQSRRQ